MNFCFFSAGFNICMNSTIVAVDRHKCAGHNRALTDPAQASVVPTCCCLRVLAERSGMHITGTCYWTSAGRPRKPKPTTRTDFSPFMSKTSRCAVQQSPRCCHTLCARLSHRILLEPRNSICHVQPEHAKICITILTLHMGSMQGSL